MPAYIIILAVIMIIIFIFVFVYVSKEEKRIQQLTENGPFSIATIESVEKKRRKNTDGIRYYYECRIKYLDLHGIERITTIDMYYEDIPVGGEIKIAYNADKFTEVYLVKALFMNEPEYIEKMIEKGFERTEDGFIRKNSLLRYEKK